MKLQLIRHGKTAGNLQKKYVGRTDEPLCPEGIAELQIRLARGSYLPVEAVFASPMKRCMQTARLIYPNMRCKAVEGLQETDFGAFEYQSYEQLRERTDYQRFLDSRGAIAPPGGESRQQTKGRILKAFHRLTFNLLKTECVSAALIVHGGTVMEVMEHYVGGDYYDWQVPNGAGYLLEISASSKNEFPTVRILEQTEKP